MAARHGGIDETAELVGSERQRGRCQRVRSRSASKVLRRAAAANRELLDGRSTTSGFGAAMMGGGRPNVGQMMAMMNGGGSAVGHMVNLRLSSREKPSGAPQANHFIPAGMAMGQSLPLVTPEEVKRGPSVPGAPGSYQKPRGRMLIYWGCGEHAPSPTVIDFAKVAEGQIPPGLQALSRMGRAMGRVSMREPTAESSAGFGEWPNVQDSRAVPASASLVGAHRIEGNYSPAIAFTLGQGQDFMPGLGLHEMGAFPSGAVRLDWTPATQATGYALAILRRQPERRHDHLDLRQERVDHALVRL